MIPVWAQKNLDESSWPEIQRLHKSLGLKATAGARTRRHLQQNIIAATSQSQPAEPVAPEAIATPLTCSTCPLAQLIEDNRYCCGLTDAVVRGHWEAKSDDCYKAVADTCEVEVPETTTEVEALTPVEIATEPEPVISLAEKLTGLTRHPFRYRHDIHQGGHSFSAASFGLCECSRCEAEREVPLNEQRRGSHQIMLERLSQVKAPTPVIQPPKNRADVQNFTLDLSVLSVAATNNAARNSEAEGTIHWHSPLQGTIAGKKGALRNFYIRSRNCLININLNDPATYEIMLAVNANFTAAESKHPNVRHQQIRSAIEAGRVFAPKTFKNSPQFLMHTENYRDIGRIMQGKDGRWWAWLNSGITGHPFDSENQAYKYLDFAADQRNQSQKLQACVN